jgi:hypothetical protein
MARELVDADAHLALVALGELAEHRLTVELVPSSHPARNRHDRVRVVVDENPEWYRAFVARRPKRGGRPKRKPRTRKGYRRQVRRALERVAAGEPWDGAGWIGWELLELLRERDARERERWSA